MRFRLPKNAEFSLITVSPKHIKVARVTAHNTITFGFNSYANSLTTSTFVFYTWCIVVQYAIQGMHLNVYASQR
jgi:hypothetical protein